MAYSIEAQDNILLLKVDVLLNELENKKILEEVEDHIFDEHNHIIVDLADLQFLNSMGLNFLISLLTKSRNSGGETVIINIPEQVSKLLVVTKLKDILIVKESMDEALKVFAVQD